MLNSLQKKSRQAARADGSKFDDEARFLRSWLEKPLMTGAVAPSGKALARTMASYVDPMAKGPVIELGPGTGPVTDALVNRGIEQERLVLIEFNPDFCRLLTRRFPRATIVQGDAYGIEKTLAGGSRYSGLRRRLQPSAVHASGRGAHRPLAAGTGADAATGAVHPVHLCGHPAHPQTPRRLHHGRLLPRLAQHSAGTGLGLSRGVSRRPVTPAAASRFPGNLPSFAARC